MQEQCDDMQHLRSLMDCPMHVQADVRLPSLSPRSRSAPALMKSWTHGRFPVAHTKWSPLHTQHASSAPSECPGMRVLCQLQEETFIGSSINAHCMSYPVNRLSMDRRLRIPSSVLIYGVCQHARTGAEQFSDLLHIPLPGMDCQSVLRWQCIIWHYNCRLPASAQACASSTSSSR